MKNNPLTDDTTVTEEVIKGTNDFIVCDDDAVLKIVVSSYERPLDVVTEDPLLVDTK